LLLAAAWEVFRTLALGNVHEVVPGRVYRSGQLSGRALEKLVRQRGIRTVINLRGCCAPESWYLQEARATHQLDINQEDITFSAGHLPPTHELRRLIEVLEYCEYPVVFHCFRGVDRTGLAATIALLLLTDVSLDRAAAEMSLRYLHLPWGRTGNLDRFLNLYREWLEQQGRTHDRQAFRCWALEHYCPGPCRAHIQRLDAGPVVCVAGKPFVVRVRCRNSSIRTWHLSPVPNKGIYVAWSLLDGERRTIHTGTAGLFHAEVPPGQSVDVTVAVPAVAMPGKYLLRVDLNEAQHCLFRETGSEPLDIEVVIR